MSLDSRLAYAGQHFPEEIKEIRADIEDCKIAADWVDDNLVEVMQFFQSDIKRNYSLVARFLRNESKPEDKVKKTLLSEIETALVSRVAYMKEGLTPTTEVLFSRDFHEDYYRYLFESFLLKLVPPSKSGLTNAQANQLASYVNRFIIDQL